MAEVFRNSGLLPPADTSAENGGQNYLLKSVPGGLVNINFGTHTCVHMGTQIWPDESVEAPTHVSYPLPALNSNLAPLYTLVMMDMDNGNYLHWMIVNIPGSKVNDGQVVTGYVAPAPKENTGSHRYVFLVMRQDGGEFEFPAQTAQSACDETGRAGFNLESFREENQLSEPIAANYFTLEYDEFVDTIQNTCQTGSKPVSFAK